MKPIDDLGGLVRNLVGDGVLSREDWHEWKRSNAHVLTQVFGYRQQEGMPDVTQIVAPHFHSEYKLVGLNYTPAAGVSLHHYDGGWTPTLRHCRGTVYDHEGRVRAFPFPKFFNFGEIGGEWPQGWPGHMPEITTKEDGHLLIIFPLGDDVIVTTRGDYESNTAKVGDAFVHISGLATLMLQLGLRDVTVLCELIHPETKVTIDHGNREALILIGLYDNLTGRDMGIEDLRRAGDMLRLEVVQQRLGMDRIELCSIPQNPGASSEGYVARWEDGTRVKFKYKGYVDLNKEEREARKDHQPKSLAGVGRRPPDRAIQKGAPWLRSPTSRR